LWIEAATGDLVVALIPAVWAFLGVVVATLGTVFVQAMKSRSERSSSPQGPAAHDGASLMQVAREVARDIGQLDQRTNDNDEAIDLIDRAQSTVRRDLDDVLTFLDRKEPGWRGR
jgi:hypothetical protein